MTDFPFLVAIGIMLIFLGFFLIILGMMRVKESACEEITQEKIKGGGVILIGPVPIVFGTDRRYALFLMILAIVLMLLAVLNLR